MWTDARVKKTAKMSYDSFPAPETIELDPTFLETVVYQDRTYQSYAINNLTYLVPIDEVLIPEELPHIFLILDYRKKLNGFTTCTLSCLTSSTDD
jgi:hypothetical protein